MEEQNNYRFEDDRDIMEQINDEVEDLPIGMHISAEPIDDDSIRAMITEERLKTYDLIEQIIPKNYVEMPVMP